MNILEAIKERCSVRSFDGTSMTDTQRAALIKAVDSAPSPFGGHLSIRLRSFNLKEGFRPGTYGMIKGASDFFIIAMGDDDNSALSVGFRFEQVVLKAWQMGLGTCWIAGTFKGSDFERDEAWPDNESLRIVCPVGTAAGKSMLERLTRLALGSKKRKPFDELFFYGDFNHPVPPGNRFAEALEMMRLAPSSTNSQPWRALVVGDSVHFYCKRRNLISVVDCGIGICHFFETEKHYNRAGIFAIDSDAPAPPAGWEYLVSYS